MSYDLAAAKKTLDEFPFSTLAPDLEAAIAEIERLKAEATHTRSLRNPKDIEALAALRAAVERKDKALLEAAAGFDSFVHSSGWTGPESLPKNYANAARTEAQRHE